MKKAIRIIFKSILYILLLIFLLLLIVPTFFKKPILARAQKELNEMLDAKVEIEDLGLSFFKSFPNLTVSLEGLRVIGKEVFEKDTLASLKAFELAVNPFSLLGSEGPQITSIILNHPRISLIVLEDGTNNWTITKEKQADELATDSAPKEQGDLSIRLKKFRIENARIGYADHASNMDARLDEFNFALSGKLGTARTTISLTADAKPVNFSMGGIPYLKNVNLYFKAGVDADLEHNIFVLTDNQLKLNDLGLSLEGRVDMSKEDPDMDLRFVSTNTSFKSLISLIPLIYMNDFEQLETKGSLSFNSHIYGIYSSTDSLYPDFDIQLRVQDAMFNYPNLPASVENVDVDLRISKKGSDLDDTKIQLETFNMSISKNEIEAQLYLESPISDPDIRAKIISHMDLNAFSGVVPMEETNLKGILDVDISMEGQLSSIQNQHYEAFNAKGNFELSGFEFDNEQTPVLIAIPNAKLTVSPQALNLANLNLVLGGSDLHLKGTIENYLGYVLKNEVIHGGFDLQSNFLDVGELLPQSDSEESSENDKDSSNMELPSIPANIDFYFSSQLNQVLFNNLDINDLKGLILVKDGKLILDGLDMQLLEGKISATGIFDTSDTLNPKLSMDLTITDIDIPSAYTMFAMVKKLAPFAKDLNGKLSSTFTYNSLLGNNMMPVINSINGAGTLQSNEVQVLSSKAFDQVKGLFKLNDQLSNTFKDLNLSFGIKDGRVIVDPFDVKIGNIMANVSGDHGLDQSLNYEIEMDIPRESLGSEVNQMADKLVSQATSMGLNLSMAENIPLVLHIGGKIGDPTVVPSIGAGAETSVKEAVVEGVKEEIQEQKEKIEQELRKDVSEEVAKIMEKAEQESENVKRIARETAATIKKEGYVNADKIEKEAAGKGIIAENIAKRAADKLREEADKQAENIIREADAKADLIMEEARKKAKELEEAG